MANLGRANSCIRHALSVVFPMYTFQTRFDTSGGLSSTSIRIGNLSHNISIILVNRILSCSTIEGECGIMEHIEELRLALVHLGIEHRHALRSLRDELATLRRIIALHELHISLIEARETTGKSDICPENGQGCQESVQSSSNGDRFPE